ncbi:MAG: substrate-binding domain-containing protein [Campylobacterales bacterium]|nr:substrate-binding domain-containing protein [Campylobacterales bacterium]
MLLSIFLLPLHATEKSKLVYIVSDIEIPFWNIMSRGVIKQANELGYTVEVYSAQNNNKKELEALAKSIQKGIEGIILSPVSSSSAATLIKLAKKQNIPVVVADIGSESSDYISYISSDNRKGAYDIGKILARQFKQRGYNKSSSIGIIAIPQNRENGKLRTDGFLEALSEEDIKTADLKQQRDFSCQETYNFTKELLEKYPNIKALWLQGSNRYKGALKAFEELNREDVMLVTFDAEPEFSLLIEEGIIVGAAMQQPYLIGKEAVKVLDDYFHGKRIVKNIELPVLAISKENVVKNHKVIQTNVLGIVE